MQHSFDFVLTTPVPCRYNETLSRILGAYPWQCLEPELLSELVAKIRRMLGSDAVPVLGGQVSQVEGTPLAGTCFLLAEQMPHVGLLYGLVTQPREHGESMAGAFLDSMWRNVFLRPGATGFVVAVVRAPVIRQFCDEVGIGLRQNGIELGAAEPHHFRATTGPGGWSVSYRRLTS